MGRFYAAKEYAALGSAQAPKAKMLGWLIEKRLSVPEYCVYVPELNEAPAQADVSTRFPSGSFAVRSASMIEDDAKRSFAGQFETVLDVPAPHGLVGAMEAVLAASSGDRVSAYHGTAGPAAQHVVVQQMIRGKVSGVAFSRNPMTGLNEVVIEAITGRGDQLVDQGVTPERYVWRGRGLIGSPQNEILPGPVVEEIAQTTERLERAFGEPIDLEWTWDGATLWWLQARPITGLENVKLYSNRISREVMPGMITPLVWSINVPLVNGAWIRFLERGVGPTGLKPEDLAKQFAFRSYFNMTALGRVFELLGMPPDALEVMMGLPNTPRPRFRAPQRLLVRLPRLLGFAGHLWAYEKRIASQVDWISRVIAECEHEDWAILDQTQVIAKIERLLPEIGHAAELNIVVPVLANVYAAWLRRSLAKRGIDYSEIDLTRDMAHYDDFNPKPHLNEIGRRLSEGLDATGELEHFMARFGHLSENTNDLALATWRERTDHVLEMARVTSGSSPATTTSSKSLDDALQGRHGMIRLVAKRAQRFQLFRENVSYHYARLYAQLRPAFLTLGAKLVGDGTLADAADIFFLQIGELRDLVSGHANMAISAMLEDRKNQFEAMRDVRMPEAIYTDNFQPLPGRTGDGSHKELTGTGVARGQARGPFRVLRGFDDFGRVESGDIIVIPFSDVSWTPVFAKASGVVSEAGGMLSHSAIVAREYGIPCIVSVENALDLPDGALGMIDGVSGTVLVLED
ncbi:MAG: hypothetical protein KDJ19_00005 [Hyphomicrobiaceae bacterium]|nr:hypothetical protein [Hyphomicrobiaceae bacterium]MCC0023805.1 hypothetical protein [Hyphomicrobiaceae bacterium]